ncbi:hypothetical protein RHS04_08913 [Rhizoctonia solani]|uniref:Transmembrane protein n=2 Tax=Rhizoctonia solani TaxID=456999 RepID=A0A8H7H2Z8_9AGAM|nr:hypothetical protein RHS04_08913 [Rhizoctonia solani]
MNPLNLRSSNIFSDLGPGTPLYHKTVFKDEETSIRKNPPWMTRASSILPLVMHYITSTGIALTLMYYMNNRPFNSTHRRPLVQTIDGKLPTSFSLTQSDIVTVLSSLLVVQKWALMAWVVPLCWSITIFLMERNGLHRQDLKALVKYRVLMPQTYTASIHTLIIGTLLLISLAANLTSPIITGSIAWDPRNTPISYLSTTPIHFLEFEDEFASVVPGPFIDMYLKSATFRQSLAHWGPSLVNIAWGRASEKALFKRVSKFVELLAINSTIETVALPYFTTDSIQWIRNPSELPDYIRNMHPEDVMYASLNLSPGGNVTIVAGAALLIPNLSNPTGWSINPWASRTIEEKRLLIYAAGSIEKMSPTATRRLPKDTYIYVDEANMDTFLFAWITFRAGAGRCKDYRSLEMAATVAAGLAYQNTSIPYISENLNDYIEAILLRSYSAAWNSIANFVSTSQIVSGYHPALPVLVAKVNKARVFGWLGLQLSVTLFSIVFLVLQQRTSKFSPIGDVTLAAFYLDTTSLPESDSPYAYVNGALRVYDEDDRLKVKVVRDLDKVA